MKTRISSSVVLLLFLFLCIGFSSCDNDGNSITNPSIVGKWQAIEYSVFGYSEMFRSKEKWVVEYKSDGKVITTHEGHEPFESEYYIKDGAIYNGSSSYYNYKIKGNKMEVTFGGLLEPGCATGMTEYILYKRIR